MRAEPKFDKLMELNNLNEGDKVKLTNGDVVTFVRLKQKNFIGTMDEKSFNIPVNMFVEVVEKVDNESKMKEQKAEYMSLKKGELFFINKGGIALLFAFEEIKNGKIIGINPISKGITRIDSGMFGGKVSDLK